MTLKGAYIDDVSPAAIAELLSSDALEFTPKEISDVSIVTESLLADNTEILVVDYRLDLNKADHSNKNNYRAGLLAQAIRESVLEKPEKDFPIILVSSEDNIRSFFPDKTAHDLFDAKYKKESLNKDDFLAVIIKELVSLSLGYKEIHKRLTEPGPVQELLKLSVDEIAILDDSHIQIEIETAKAPHIAARAILTSLINRTGLLLQPKDILARLGIKSSPSTKEYESIISILRKEGCLYQGVFADGWQRVWRHRFDKWTETLLDKPITSIPGDERASLLSTKFEMPLSPAVSKWSASSKELFSFACASCGAPTEIKNSLSVQEDAFFKYLEKRRICYDCIQTDAFEKAGLHISNTDHPLVEKIKSHVKKSSG